jgi:metal-responsive CopG/Arc/MetJ family transcriptional regulator
MNKRINVMLPDETLAVLDRVTTRGGRSRFVSSAIIHYDKSHGRRNLRDRLKAGYQANAQENLKIALEWFPLEEDAWQKSHAKPKDGR